MPLVSPFLPPFYWSSARFIRDSEAALGLWLSVLIASVCLHDARPPGSFIFGARRESLYAMRPLYSFSCLLFSSFLVPSFHSTSHWHYDFLAFIACWQHSNFGSRDRYSRSFWLPIVKLHSQLMEFMFDKEHFKEATHHLTLDLQQIQLDNVDKILVMRGYETLQRVYSIIANPSTPDDAEFDHANCCLIASQTQIRRGNLLC